MAPELGAPRSATPAFRGSPPGPTIASRAGKPVRTIRSTPVRGSPAGEGASRIEVIGRIGRQRRRGQRPDHLRSCSPPPRLERRQSRRDVRGEAGHRTPVSNICSISSMGVGSGAMTLGDFGRVRGCSASRTRVHPTNSDERARCAGLRLRQNPHVSSQRAGRRPWNDDHESVRFGSIARSRVPIGSRYDRPSPLHVTRASSPGRTVGDDDLAMQTPRRPIGRSSSSTTTRRSCGSSGRTSSGTGFGVVTAADGPAALDAIERHRPALVVLDLMLPELDGRAVIRAVRRDEQAGRDADPRPLGPRHDPRPDRRPRGRRRRLPAEAVLARRSSSSGSRRSSAGRAARRRPEPRRRTRPPAARRRRTA